MGKEGGRRVMGEEESEIAVPPPSSLLAEPLAGSSGGGVGAARVAGMRVRGLGEPPEPLVRTTRGQESFSFILYYKHRRDIVVGGVHRIVWRDRKRMGRG